MNKTGGFELSINFFVVIILSIVIISFGMFIFSKMFDKGMEFQEQMDQANKERIDALLDTGEPVTVPRNVKGIEAGDDFTFHMGVSNELSNDLIFQVMIVEDEDPTSLNFPLANIIYNKQQITLAPGERSYKPFKIVVPGGLAKGTYLFNVSVCYDDANTTSSDLCGVTGLDDRYYEMKKLYINVP